MKLETPNLTKIQAEKLATKLRKEGAKGVSVKSKGRGYSVYSTIGVSVFPYKRRL